MASSCYYVFAGFEIFPQGDLRVFYLAAASGSDVARGASQVWMDVLINIYRNARMQSFRNGWPIQESCKIDMAHVYPFQVSGEKNVIYYTFSLSFMFFILFILFE